MEKKKDLLDELRGRVDAVSGAQLVASARTKAEAYCSQAERCCHDVMGKLEKWQLDHDAARQVIEHLKKEGFLDEGRYARAFVHDKLRFEHWGRVKIQMVLRQKGVDSTAVQEALAGIDEDEYLEVLREVIASKERSVKASSDYERRMKLLKSVAARGFEPTLASKLIGSADDF